MADLNRILLVEDNPADVELTLAALAEHNLANEVVVTKDGEQALDYLFRRGQYAMRGNGNPAVIMLDIKMPKVDGLTVLKTIKKERELMSIPVVMLTSSREDRDLAECYALGANAYVVKPVNFDEFVAAVSKVGLFWGVLNEPPPGSVKRR